ncbi:MULTISPECIES: hypothetical protein [Lysobacter]|uniref:hypothetical protein n=1 Tax=Lysobacter TaxID=68 RepID=UPI000A9189DC|nr:MULTISPECIES: hypothetical protein [Lysobacter]
MRIRNALLLSLLACAPATAAIYAPPPAYYPLYQTYNPTITDYFYTLNYYEAYGAAGYQGPSVFTYVEKTPQPSTVALRRYWKGSPQNDHIYLTDQFPEEISYVLNNGFVYEGIEGYIYTQQVPGSLPVHRLNYNYGNGDLMHKYVTSEAERQALVQQGWGYDRVQGYVPSQSALLQPNGTVLSGYPALPGGAVVARRCDPVSTPNFCSNPQHPGREPHYRNNFYGYRGVSSTVKPAGSNVQKIQFDVWSPDFFIGSDEHIVIGVHGGLTVGTDQITLEGLGITLGQSQMCGDGVSQVEGFWLAPGTPAGYGGFLASTCPARTADPNGKYFAPIPMENHHPYRVVIKVSDAGTIQYSVLDGYTLASIQGQTFNAVNQYPGGIGGFPNKTGYYIAPSTTSNRDYTLYLSNLSVSWQNGF